MTIYKNYRMGKQHDQHKSLKKHFTKKMKYNLVKNSDSHTTKKREKDIRNNRDKMLMISKIKKESKQSSTFITQSLE